MNNSYMLYYTSTIVSYLHSIFSYGNKNKLCKQVRKLYAPVDESFIPTMLTFKWNMQIPVVAVFE